MKLRTAKICGRCRHKQSSTSLERRCYRCSGTLYPRMWLCQWCRGHVTKIAGGCSKCRKSLLGSMEF